MVRTYNGVEIPENDDQRVKAVEAYRILDTPPEQEYDDITTLAAEITGCPVSYISIFDKTRSWLKSSYGLPPNRPPRPREQSMCAPTICQTEMMLIPDLRQNARYSNLPAVVNPPHARFYCGMPLINRDSYALGTLCVWSPDETNLKDGQLDALSRLARMVISMLERRRDLVALECEYAEVVARLDRSRAAIERAEGVAYRLLPQSVAARMLADADVAPRQYDEVTVISVRLSGIGAAMESVPVLQAYVAEIDRVVADAGLERLGLTGDVYRAIAGVLHPAEPHLDVAHAASSRLEDALETLSANRRASAAAVLEHEMSITSGSLVAVLSGSDRVSLDYWGPALSDRPS